MPRDLSRISARLESLGLRQLAQRLLNGITTTEELNFGSLAQAKRVQTLLYDFLWFYPLAKAKVSISLNKVTGTLTIKPRGKTERRGRKRLT